MKLKRFGKSFVCPHAVNKHYGDVESKLDKESLRIEYISIFENEITPAIVSQAIALSAKKRGEKFQHDFRRKGRKLKAMHYFQLLREGTAVKLGVSYESNCGDLTGRTEDCYFAQIVFEWNQDSGMAEVTSVFPVVKIDSCNPLAVLHLK